MKQSKKKRLLFKPLIPNAITVKAMGKARRGKTAKHKSLEGLMVDLRTDD